MLSFKIPKIFVEEWLSLTLANGPSTKEVVVLFCPTGVLDSSCSCEVSLTRVFGSETASFRINNSSSVNFSTYSLGRVSSTSIDLSWTWWASSVCVLAHYSSFITTLADSITAFVLRLYTRYALLDVKYPRKNLLSLFASNFSRFSQSRRM